MLDDAMIGRRSELEHLLEVVRSASGTGGRAVFVEGFAGMGKTVLLANFKEAIRGLSGEARPIVASGFCDPGSGNHDAYEPFKEILRGLAEPKSKEGIAKLVLEVLKETGPDLLGLIPGIGTAATAAKMGIKATSLVGKWSVGADDDAQSSLAQSIQQQYLETVQALVAKANPLVLIIEDAHWIDSASAKLLKHLTVAAQGSPLVLIVTCRPNFLEGSMLHEVRQELLMADLVDVVRLRAFDEQEVREYIRHRYDDDSMSLRVTPWLTQLSGGLPMFIVHYLSLLEEQSIIKRVGDAIILDGTISNEGGEWVLRGPLGELPVPQSVQEVLIQRLDKLEDQERWILELGSVQGLSFMSAVLVALLHQPSGKVLRDLRRIELEEQVIKSEAPEAWARRETEVYTFEHALLRQALYSQLGRLEREQYHAIVAQVLDQLLHKLHEEGQSIPRRLLLEASRHYRSAGEFRPAARYALEGAQSCYAEGAFHEARQLCEQALQDLREQELHPDDDLLRAQVIQLLLATSELKWRGKPELQSNVPMEELLAEAEAAAARAADPHLRAQLQLLKGKSLVASGRLDQAVEQFEIARSQLHDVGDDYGELAALTELGHHQVGLDPERGIRILREAQVFIDDRDATLKGKVPQSILDRVRYRLEGAIGIAEFDQGHFDGALVPLRRAVADLKRDRVYDLLALTSNFLGQTLIAAGQYEDAEVVLHESISLLGGVEPEPTPQMAYNLGLLGKLYLEWGRIDQAAGALGEGWEQTRATWDHSLSSLVANYYAELLMHPEFSDRDLDVARRLLENTVKESLEWGFARSTVVAHSLLAQRALMCNEPEEALPPSRKAAERLWRAKMLPAVRAEEVFFIHYQVLRANGNIDEASSWLDRAYRILEAKAASLRDDELRRVFRERVPVSKAILDSVRSMTTPPVPREFQRSKDNGAQDT
jgi:tetratricopeptide (TPR) repeat protein